VDSPRRDPVSSAAGKRTGKMFGPFFHDRVKGKIGQRLLFTTLEGFPKRVFAYKTNKLHHRYVKI
jgi:hypothetical protein